MEGRLKSEIARGLEADALAPPGPLEEFRYKVNKRLFRVYFDPKTETESSVEIVVVRKEQPKDEFDGQLVPNLKEIGCNVGDYWSRQR